MLVGDVMGELLLPLGYNPPKFAHQMCCFVIDKIKEAVLKETVVNYKYCQSNYIIAVVVVFITNLRS